MELDWKEVTIPDGAPAVAVARLREETGGATWSLVRFPPGWSRTVTGHYQVDEDFWVIEGHLEMSGIPYPPGAGAHVAAGTPRSATRSKEGALTVARFAGTPRWVREE